MAVILHHPTAFGSFWASYVKVLKIDPYCQRPEVLFKTCVAMKFVDDNDDENHKNVVQRI